MSDFAPRGIDCATRSLSEIKDGPLRDAVRLWDTWRDREFAPPWPAVDLSALPPVLLPLATVVDVLGDGADYRYRFWGTGLTELFGRDESGTHLSAHAVTRSGQLRYAQFNLVVTSRRPQLFMTAFALKKTAYARKLNLRLPVSDAPGDVTKILSLSTMEAPALGPFENLHEFWPKPPTG